MAPSSQKNTKSVVKMWRGPLHAYHNGLRAVITEAATSGSLSGPSVRGPGGTRISHQDAGPRDRRAKSNYQAEKPK